MKQPRPINTLAEAAKWMTEATDTEWVSESLLDFIYRKMVDAISQYNDAVDDADEVSKAKHLSSLHRVSCLYAALPPRTRVVYRPVVDRIYQSQRGDVPLLPLKRCWHVSALLQHGATELPYPLINEPWNDDDEDYEEDYECHWIDADIAPIITSESLRIHDYDLSALADIFNEQNKQQAMPTSIDELDLSIRSKNCLEAMNIRSIDELVKHSRSDLLRAPNFGRKSINEIQERLALRGLKLSD